MASVRVVRGSPTGKVEEIVTWGAGYELWTEEQRTCKKHQRHPQLDGCRIGDATGTVGLTG
jgi:hypothetical protein